MNKKRDTRRYVETKETLGTGGQETERRDIKRKCLGLDGCELLCELTTYEQKEAVDQSGRGRPRKLQKLTSSTYTRLYCFHSGMSVLFFSQRAIHSL